MPITTIPINDVPMPAPGMRFYDELVKGYAMASNPAVNSGVTLMSNRHMFEALTDQSLQRLILSHRQADIFWRQAEAQALPPAVQAECRWPFDRFYLECTAPLPIMENYLLKAIIIRSPAASTHPSGCSELIAFISSPAMKYFEIAGLGFGYKLDTGQLLWDTTANPIFHETYVKEAHTIRREAGDRLGRWMGWVAAYLLARGIHIVEEPVSRQQRRRMQMDKKLPGPWHLITVQPQHVIGGDNGHGREHGYRYDVMGHFRFVRNRMTWVRPHQRGLKHDLYIPATRKFE